MHKKPLVAVLILGLLFLLPSFADAARDLGNSTLGNFNETPLPMVARNLVKDPVGATTPVGTPTAMQLGVSRTGATYCDGWGQGGALGQYGSWFYGDEFYAFYQDPEEFGSCSGSSGLYTFDVTEIDWWIVNNDPATFVLDFQPLTYENATDNICPFPGAVLCAGPLYTVDLSADPSGGYILTFPFVDQCCVFGPYFAGIYAATFVGPGTLGIVVDDDGATPCWQYNDYGGGWLDLSVDLTNDFVGDIELFSAGNAYDQNACPGLPGACAYKNPRTGTFGGENAATIWDDPDGSTGGLLEDYYVRFNADVSCTLMSMRVMLYDFNDGTVMRVRVYGDNYPGTVGGLPIPDLAPGGSNMEGYVDVPLDAASTPIYPAWLDVDLTSLGPLEYGTGQTFFVSVTTSPATPNPGTDYITVLTNTPNPSPDPNNRSGAFVGLFGQYQTFGQTFGSGSRELFLDAYTCCEIVAVEPQACDTPGPDSWPTWMHDYSRTGATSIEVGDPCGITASWLADLPLPNSFCEPTVANDRVYISYDQGIKVFDLATGGLINTVSGLPYTFGSAVRGNVTIEGAAAYLTGGAGQSISSWDLDLSVANWCNGIGSGTGPLGAQNRFGVVTVYDAGGTEIAVVGTEGGQLWAFETATGAIFAGWPTNPVILDNGVYHGTAYDGTGLYVATSASNALTGSVYRLDPLTGAVVWNVTPGADEAFWSGLSLDVDAVYLASNDPDNLGHRYKLDKTTGSTVWGFSEARSLYGAPTIARNLVYIPQDVGGVGVLAIDKNTGAPIYNFANDGVGDVSQHVTVTCDNYLFAGDREGKWWLLDAPNQTAVWGIDVPYFSIVNGTAVATHSVSGDNYAVVGLRSGGPTAGAVAAFKFNQPARPRVDQLVYSSTVPVEFGLGPGNPASEPDVFGNSGCADLNFNSFNIYDPLPDPVASTFRREQANYAAAVSTRMIDGEYNAYFDQATMGKTLAMTRRMADAELTAADAAKDASRPVMEDSKRNTSRMAASAAGLVRTSAVAVSTPLAPGSLTGVNWLFDGTNLARGFDVEEIEFITDDPDRIVMGNQPILTIEYAGGCLPASADITWDYVDQGAGLINSGQLYNTGKLGDDNSNADFDWQGSGTGDVYDAAFYLAGEEDPLTGDKQFHVGDVYGRFPRLFLPDPFPGPSCEFQGDVDVLLGYKRDGGCPGTPVEIRGEWTRTAFVDTNEARDGFGAAIGTRVEATEIGSYDPLYGDFLLQHFEVTNRDAVAKGPIYGGTFYDWDVAPDYASNVSNFSLAYNGYAIWDGATPELAMGSFDPNLPTAYGGVDPTYNRPQRINPMGEGDGSGAAVGLYDGVFQNGADTDPWEEQWDYCVTRLPQFENGPVDLVNHTSNQQDHGGLLTNKGQMLPANGTISFDQAIYVVDGSSNDFTTIEANGLELAQRAAKWAGFARGDANDDGDVNLLDVCWLLSGHQIYPDTYNGDVDLSGTVDGADEAYLLNYVTGLGPAPLGAWRFTF